MFWLSKSENRNQVHYGIRLDTACVPEGREPVLAYWRDLERGPTATSPLLAHEEPAYGIARQRIDRPARADAHHVVTLTLRALPARPIQIRVTRDATGRCLAEAHTRIDRTRAILRHAHANVGFLRLVSLRLVGREARTGTPVDEVIRP